MKDRLPPCKRDFCQQTAFGPQLQHWFFLESLACEPTLQILVLLTSIMGNRWGNSGNSVRLYFLGSRITADGDCSHEIKRRLLLGRKVMTNLDSTFKSRDITLPNKVRLVKVMVFPVVTYYGCESWTVKKAELRRIDAFELWCWRRPLRVPWTAGDPTSPIWRRSTLGFLWKEWC